MMVIKSAIKHSASLNSASLQKLFLKLDEKSEELLSGGCCKEKFVRTKPHVNIGTKSHN